MWIDIVFEPVATAGESREITVSGRQFSDSLLLHAHQRQESETDSDPWLIEPDPYRQACPHSVPGNSQNAHCRNQWRLLRSRARGRYFNHHLRATVQLDVLLRAEQDAGRSSHPWILLPRRIVRQQHAGNRRGLDGYGAGFGYDGPRRGAPVSCGSCSRAAARALRRATRCGASRCGASHCT
jgi:hypothetical protein